MRYLIPAISAVALLCGCTTPETVMRNDKTGETVICGGHNEKSFLLGVPGYYSQKADDAECVSNHLENGYKRVNSIQPSQSE